MATRGTDFPRYDTNLSLLIDQIEDLIDRLDKHPGEWTDEDIEAKWRLVHRLEEVDPNKEHAA